MYSDVVMRADALRKEYHIYPTPVSRLKQLIFGHRRKYYDEFVALQGLSFELRKGEVLGVVGRNGAGKSTLLQLLCGTLTPSSGELEVNGRIAALLELGSGFNTEFTGRENIYLSASVMGLSRARIDELLDEIIDFSGIRPFIDQPVKTYSSGMFVRLAFSVATSVDPDILVIDEALSVGDGDFGRRSFDRIMAMRDAGKTILFCSHSLFQLEALCNRAIWLDNGRVVEDGSPDRVVAKYQSFLDQLSLEQTDTGLDRKRVSEPDDQGTGIADTRILSTRVSADGVVGKTLQVKSRLSDVAVEVEFASEFVNQDVGVAVVIHASSGLLIASSGTWNDHVTVTTDAAGRGYTRVVFERFPLLRGRYTVGVLLFGEDRIFIHDEADPVATLEVVQSDSERGVVSLPHTWDVSATELAVEAQD